MTENHDQASAPDESPRRKLTTPDELEALETQASDAPASPESRPAPKRNRKRKRKRAHPASDRAGLTVDRHAARHQARVVAMQSLYEYDLTDHDLDEILTRLSAREDDDENDGGVIEEEIPVPVATRATRLIHGVLEHAEDIDRYIADAAPAYPIPQLASIDRNVLRVAVYELIHEPDIPFKAVINEAVEIAKRYGGPNSGRFVNGVLGTINDRIPRPSPAAAQKS